MAESLRRLINIGSFRILQDKLEKWLDDYDINSCDQNVARCCEVIELNAKVQSQLFKLLCLTASEGGMYGGSNIIKSRLLPWLGQNFFTSGGSVTGGTSLNVLAEAAASQRKLVDLKDTYERSVQTLEGDMKSTQAENDDLRNELEDTKNELNRNLRSSTSEKMMTEAEIRDLKSKLTKAREDLEYCSKARPRDLNKLLQDIENRELRQTLELAESTMSQLSLLHTKPANMESHELRIRKLREDLAYLTGKRSALTGRPPNRSVQGSDISTGLAETQDELLRMRIGSPIPPVTIYDREIQNLKDEMRLSSTRPPLKSTYTPTPLPPYVPTYLPRSSAPLSLDDPVQRVRQNNVVSRYNDMFAQDRLDAMDTLRRYSMDAENNQRIIFAVVQEASTVARLSFRQFKSKVRTNIASCHLGPESLEEAVQDYINRNVDLYDLPGMVADVIRGMNRNLGIFLPPRASYAVIQPFIREACKLAWQMAALAFPIDIAIASDGELFDDIKYRRSYDSEYLAPLVNHHVWPALTQGSKVLMKGEAVTKRGASLNVSTPYRSRSRSPSRLLARSRSPSPAAIRARSTSPVLRARSLSPSRAYRPSLYGR